MSDEQLIVLAAAILAPNLAARIPLAVERDSRAAVIWARELFEENRKFGPLPTQALPESRKATLSHPTIEERNEAHAARQYDKRRGA